MMCKKKERKARFFFPPLLLFFFTQYNLKMLKKKWNLLLFTLCFSNVRFNEKNDKHKLEIVYLLPPYLSRICVNEGNTPFLTTEHKNERKKKRTHASADDYGIIVFSSLLHSSKFERVRRQDKLLTSQLWVTGRREEKIYI